jgi:ribosomal protein S18 acetylase RimI-like enzyme
MDSIGPMRSDLLDRATLTFERAFAGDSMFAWMFPDPVQRANGLRWLNRVPLEYGLRYGHVTQSHNGMAAAIWITPAHPLSLVGMIRSGMLSVPFHIGFGAFVKFMKANETMERIHKRHAPGPHWYLLAVGVDPELQGRGLGTALVQEGLARADQATLPVYLETSDERNVAYYERHGFAVVESARLGSGGPPAWGMLRPASS